MKKQTLFIYLLVRSFIRSFIRSFVFPFLPPNTQDNVQLTLDPNRAPPSISELALFRTPFKEVLQGQQQSGAFEFVAVIENILGQGTGWVKDIF